MAPAVFKYAKQGTSLANDWRLPGQGGLYDDFVLTLRSAIDSLIALGHQPRVRAVLWIQGESDAADAESARLYASRLRTLVEHMRSEVLFADVPFVLGADERNPFILDNPAVIDAQHELAHSLPCVARSSMAGLERADRTHLTPEGIIEHGHRLFEDYRKLSAVCPDPARRSETLNRLRLIYAAFEAGHGK